MYFIENYETQADARHNIMAVTDITLIREIQNALHENNPFIQSFIYHLQNRILKEYSIRSYNNSSRQMHQFKR